MMSINESEIIRQITKIIQVELPQALENNQWGDIKNLGKDLMEDIETLKDHFGVDIKSSFDIWADSQ